MKSIKTSVVIFLILFVGCTAATTTPDVIKFQDFKQLLDTKSFDDSLIIAVDMWYQSEKLTGWKDTDYYDRTAFLVNFERFHRNEILIGQCLGRLQTRILRLDSQYSVYTSGTTDWRVVAIK